ncbi:hypothetical protein LCGC14_0928190 [marine sediment metagenome]|uniref:Uncharacterized protein n=1 Tax=marine sediment metagenome TaxID=412755 RepID=A0A0F9RVC7_9ZZZZ
MKRLCIALFLITLFPSMAWSACSTSWSRSKDWGSSEVLTETDLEGEYDRGYTFGTDCFNTSSGHDHDSSNSRQLDWDNVWSDAAHDHSSAAEGGASSFDWDSVWTDAVHSHESAGEGGTVQAHASTVVESITVGLVTTEAGASGKSMIVDGDGGASWGTPLVDEISDSDGDTKVQVEESNNENKIRFDTGGVERAVLDSSGLQLAMDAASPPQANTMVKDSIVKAWVNFQGSVTINDSFNVSSITDNTTGDFTITWDRDFADGNYAIWGSAIAAASAKIAVITVKNGTTLAVGSVTIEVRNASNAALDVDPTMVVAIGNQ